ncbi:MAG TPA: hypothetical protein VJM76_07300 [Gammaproteobacteria bacterium]|nr:hypothetical protein [Gammaproteobacteria bacterium]
MQLRKALLLLILLIMPTMASGEFALTVLAGQSTRNHWEDFFISPGSLDFASSGLLLGALSTPVARYWNDDLTLEVEGQVAKHFGEQTHWEVNAPVVARWHRFPWNETVATTAAFGVGPSWSSRTPPLEVEVRGDSQPWLFHWFMELTLGPPGAEWSASLRLHHRSTGFGLAGDNGGLDTLAIGIRKTF